MLVTRIAGALIVLAAMLAGCKSAPQKKGYMKPEFVSLLTDGVTIRAADGSWEISGSDPVAPPFYSDPQNWDPTKGDILDGYTRALHRKGLIARGEGRLVGRRWREGPPVGPAQRVFVDYPGLKKPLYGVLAIYAIRERTKDSSAKRAYRMAVPANRVEQAKGARVSVVYQPYKLLMWSSGFARTWKEDRISWILWMSDAPFAGHDAGPPPQAGD